MATGKPLFHLIQTLSKSEKKNFTQNNNLQRRDKNYNAVFTVLTKIGEYDKNEVLDRLKMSPTQLRAAETYLYEKIIDTLKISYAKNSIDIQLQDLVLEAQILHKRGLYQPAINIFTKAESLALEHHKRAFLLEIIPKKADAIVTLQKQNVREQIDIAYQVAHDAIAILKEEMLYRHENIKLTATFRTHKQKGRTNCTASKEGLKVYQKAQIEGFPSEGSFFSQYYYYNILALSAHLQGKLQTAIKHQKEAVKIWEQHPHIIQKKLSAYMTQLANLINYLICAKEYREGETIIRKLADLKTSSIDEKGEQFQNLYFYKQMLYLNEKDYEASRLLVKEIEDGLKLYGQKISVSRELTFLYNIGLTFWLMGNFEDALFWFSKIPGSNRFNENRPDVVRNVHLLQLAIFYEINNKRAIENIENKLRKVKRDKETNDFEDTLIKFFSKLSKCVRSSLEEQTIFLDFKTALKELEGNQIMGYEEYCVWVDQHINVTLKEDDFFTS